MGILGKIPPKRGFRQSGHPSRAGARAGVPSRALGTAEPARSGTRRTLAISGGASRRPVHAVVRRRDSEETDHPVHLGASRALALATDHILRADANPEDSRHRCVHTDFKMLEFAS